MSAVSDTHVNKVIVFVRLLNEGIDVSRPTDAEDLGDGRFRILPTTNYDPDDEIWEFPPGTIVCVELRRGERGEYLLAVMS